MAVTKEDILESISNMTVMEVVDLISEMEEKFGVTAAAAVAAAPAAAALRRDAAVAGAGGATSELHSPRRSFRTTAHAVMVSESSSTAVARSAARPFV